MDHFEDEQIVCADCGATFVFTGGEAAFYAERNLAFPPKRCKECRAARKGKPGDGGSARGPARGAPQPSYGGGDRAPARSDGRRPPRYTGAVNEYRSPMQDNAYAPAPAWGGGAPSQARGGAPRRDGSRAPRGGPPNDGNYRAPAFRTAPEPSAPRGPGRARPRDDRPAGPATQTPRTNGALFDITCMTCGTRAQVPFRPIEGRDVFCQACYRARKPLRDPMD